MRKKAEMVKEREGIESRGVVVDQVDGNNASSGAAITTGTNAASPADDLGCTSMSDGLQAVTTQVSGPKTFHGFIIPERPKPPADDGAFPQAPSLWVDTDIVCRVLHVGMCYLRL